MAIPLEAECHQLDDAKSDYQHRECYVIVLEPMPSNHDALPYSNAQVLLGLQGVFTAPLFQGDFAARLFGFVLLGENRASVSQFVAEIRSASLWCTDSMKPLRLIRGTSS